MVTGQQINKWNFGQFLAFCVCIFSCWVFCPVSSGHTFFLLNRLSILRYCLFVFLSLLLWNYINFYFERKVLFSRAKSTFSKYLMIQGYWLNICDGQYLDDVNTCISSACSISYSGRLFNLCPALVACWDLISPTEQYC